MPPGDQLNPFTLLTDDEGASDWSGQEIPDLNLQDLLGDGAPQAEASTSAAPARQRASQSGNNTGTGKKTNVARKSAAQAPWGARAEPHVATPSSEPVSSSTRRKTGVGSSKKNAISLISSDEDEQATPIPRRPSTASKSARKSASQSPTKPTAPTLPPVASQTTFKWSAASQPATSRYAMQEMDLQPISVHDYATGSSSAALLKDRDMERRKSRTSSTPAAPPSERQPSPTKTKEPEVQYGQAGPGPSTLANTSRMLDDALGFGAIVSPRKAVPTLPESEALQPMDLQPIPVNISKRANSPHALDAFGRECKRSKDDNPTAATLRGIPAPPSAPKTNLTVSPAKRGPTWATAQSQRTPSPQPPRVNPPHPPSLPPPTSDAMEGVDEPGNSSAAEMDVDMDMLATPTESRTDGVGATPAKDLLRMLGISATAPETSTLPDAVGEPGTADPSTSAPADPISDVTQNIDIASTNSAQPLHLPALTSKSLAPPSPPAAQLGIPAIRSQSASQEPHVEGGKPSAFQLAPLDLPELVPTRPKSPVPVGNSSQAGVTLDPEGWEAPLPSEMNWEGVDVELGPAAEPTNALLDMPTAPVNKVEAATETAIEEIRTEVGDIDIGAPTGGDSRSSSIVPMTRDEIDKEMRERMADPAFQEFLRAKGMTEEDWLGTKPARSGKRAGSILDITDERSGEGKAMRRAKAKALKLERSQVLQRRIKPKMTREEWRRMIEIADDFEVDQMISAHSPISSGPSTGSADGVDASAHLAVSRRASSPHAASSSTRGVTPFAFDPSEQPAPGRRGKVLREFETDEIDRWNRLLPTLSARGAVLRMIFESWISEATAADDPIADPIRVVNDVDTEDLPPDMEFQYSNRMIYHSQVPDPELGTGCGCDGPCDPDSRTCSCVKRQELYFYNTGMKGFAYDEHGHLKQDSIPIWECGPLCDCPPECGNRVIQRGRSSSTKIDLFKTKYKGWGIKARCDIPQGTFLGIYSGEMITELESERRGYLYDEIGRTYLFDCDGWQIRNPPPLDELRKLDPRLAELAERSYLRSQQAAEENDGDDSGYSAYSIDAFHWGFTRYFNHSCDPNLAISQAYVTDCNPERPMLVIFTRKPVSRNEELCISYKGIDYEELEEGRVRYEASKAKKPPPRALLKGKRRRGKNKSSASAHITNPEKASIVRDACRCGAWNCDGRMWVASAEDGSEDEDEW